jgi:hypothetical protein
MKLKPWTIALMLIIILDAIVTVVIGIEENWMILKVMNFFTLTLAQAMILKVLLCAPVVWWLDRTPYTKLTVFGYIFIYLILTGAQFAYDAYKTTM